MPLGGRLRLLQNPRRAGIEADEVRRSRVGRVRSPGCSQRHHDLGLVVIDEDGGDDLPRIHPPRGSRESVEARVGRTGR